MRLRPSALILAAAAAVCSSALGWRPAPAAAPSAAAATPAAAIPPLTPPAAGGVEETDRLLRRLETHRRLLVLAAHPDDEDSELLAVVARGMGGEAAYLSLTRGEGGQNLVGPDLGVGLGLVRSQELSAARRLDGARQYFTRAYDFGFTRSVDEAFSKWPRAVLLEDAVHVIRRFRPQVLVAIFWGTARDGHGQHQASGVIAGDAYAAAGDAKAVPALASAGETPWSPKAFYRETGYWRGEGTTVVVQTGGTDPLTGRSFYQIAMASRSLHRSQDMGTLQEPGPNRTEVGWVAGGAGREGKDLFAGVDTRLAAIAAEVPDAARRGEMERRLTRAAELAVQARASLSAPDLASAVPKIAEALRELRGARELVRPGDGGVAMLLDEKIVIAERALAGAASVTLDAIAEREVSSPGEGVEVTASVWNAGKQAVEVSAVSLESPDGWSTGAPGASRGVAPDHLEDWKISAKVPASAAATVPYFLARPMSGDLYDWADAAPGVRGEPFQPSPLAAVVRMRVAGTEIALSREVSYRFRDQATGEVRRLLRAAPAVEVGVEPDVIVWRTGEATRHLEITLTSNSPAPVAGRLTLAAPQGWPVPEARAFSLGKRGDRQFFDVALSAPARVASGRYGYRAEAVLEDGRRMDEAIRAIDYGYIPLTPQPEPATVAVAAADIRLPELRRVGYVRGAADRVPEALAAIGVPIEILGERDLLAGDLSVYDAIVIGSRAYETDAALARANGRLLDYARAGGRVIVQYQQYQFVQGGFAPYMLDIARPHDRVTDENAKVTVLDPALPLFHSPNEISEADWQGWVQERGLYFAHTWAPEYTPLLAMADPGQGEQKGGLLAARLGKGRYVYTGLAFFRQLPAGVPGAYRLFVNLIGWK